MIGVQVVLLLAGLWLQLQKLAGKLQLLSLKFRQLFIEVQAIQVQIVVDPKCRLDPQVCPAPPARSMLR